VVDLGNALHHAADKFYDTNQRLATEIAKQLGHDDRHIERVGKILSRVDAVSRWTVNVPGAHVGLHELAAIGGPAGLAISKAAYYVPVASLAYVGYQMGKATVSGKRNPVDLIAKARANIKANDRFKQAFGKAH